MMPDTSSEGREWWRGAVVYQIYPRSFQDSDGDGVGDLPGVTRRLSYVASLGVDAIWLSPFFPSPMKDFGYDVSDYCNVDPLFGTLDDFRSLLSEAHRLGLKVVIDQVWSHTSDQHPWFQQSRASADGPKAGWYVWEQPKSDGTPPNNWLASFGGAAWSWDGQRERYYLHNYLSSQPDLNVRNRDVQAALLDIGRFWLDLGVDGFRFDVANCFMHDPLLTDNPVHPSPPSVAPYWRQRHINNKSHPDNLVFLGRIRSMIDGYGDRLMLAEILDDDNVARMAEYTDGKRFHTAYSFTFLRERLTPANIRRAVERYFAAAPDGCPTWAFSNHDTMRVVTREGWGARETRVAAAKLLNTLLMALPGTICVYQGEELGLTQVDVPRHRLADPEALSHFPKHRNRDGARTPMPWSCDDADHGFGAVDPWLPFGNDHAEIAVDRQEADDASVLAHFRDLMNRRRSTQALRTGSMRFLHQDDTVLAFDRRGLSESVRFVFNLSDRPQTRRIEGLTFHLPPLSAQIVEETDHETRSGLAADRDEPRET